MSGRETETYYEILGANPDASQGQIRKAYLKLSLQFHPDKNPNGKEQFCRIGQAYEVLSDPTKRSEYDRLLATGTGTGTGTGFGSASTSASGTSASYNYNYGGTSGTSNNNNNNEQKSYDSYREQFDEHVAGMSEEELRKAMGAAAMVGSFIGSAVASRLGSKTGGKSKVGKTIAGKVGTFMGAGVGSEAGAQLVQNLHKKSMERSTYEERKRVAQQRGEAIPEKPTAGWGDLFQTVNETFSSVCGNGSGNGNGNASGGGGGGGGDNANSNQDSSSSKAEFVKNIFSKVQGAMADNGGGGNNGNGSANTNANGSANTNANGSASTNGNRSSNQDSSSSNEEFIKNIFSKVKDVMAENANQQRQQQQQQQQYRY